MKIKCFLFLFYLSPILVFGQNKALTKNKLVFQVTNQNMQSFEINAHKGLPLFGMPLKNLPRKASEKTIKGLRAYQAYFKIVEMKYLSDLFDDVDKRIFLDEPNDLVTADEKGNLSSLTSWFIADLGYKMQTKEWHKKYGTFWSIEINRGTIFDKRKDAAKYHSFLEDNISYLRSFSSKFWKEDFQDAYFVISIDVERNYDFKNKGYTIQGLDSHKKFNKWNRLYHEGYNKLVAYNYNTINTLNSYSSMKYVDNEKIIAKKSFFPLTELEAEKLIDRGVKQIFATYKIRLMFKKRDIAIGSKNLLDFEYMLESPKVVIYEDSKLTKQIGELTLN